MGRIDYQWDRGAIRALRKELGLTQSEFAARLGKHQQGVSEWERGVTRPRGSSAKLLQFIAEESRDSALQTHPSESTAVKLRAG